MKERKSVRGRTASMNKADIAPMHNDATLGRDIQSKIGEQLRAQYEDVVRQGVPDRFADLLKRLEDRSGKDRP